MWQYLVPKQIYWMQDWVQPGYRKYKAYTTSIDTKPRVWIQNSNMHTTQTPAKTATNIKTHVSNPDNQKRVLWQKLVPKQNCKQQHHVHKICYLCLLMQAMGLKVEFLFYYSVTIKVLSSYPRIRVWEVDRNLWMYVCTCYTTSMNKN